MITFSRLMTLIIIVWAAVYTISYGRWTWKEKNRLGAVMVFIIALTVIVLPVYSIFFKD